MYPYDSRYTIVTVTKRENMLAEYERVVSALEHAIHGPLQRKRDDLVTALHTVDANVVGYRRAAAKSREEEDSAPHGGARHMAAQEKLSVMQQHRTSLQHDVDAIDAFVQRVLGAAAEPPPGATPEAFARILLDEQPQLSAMAQRLLRRPCIHPEERTFREAPHDGPGPRLLLARLDALSQLLRVKDEAVKVLLQESHTQRISLAEHGAEVERTRAAMEAMQAHSHGELVHWASTADEYGHRLEELHEELRTSRGETSRAREHNVQLREQNELLRAHCEKLRRMVVRTAVGAAHDSLGEPTREMASSAGR